jgi:ribonuclease VapC
MTDYVLDASAILAVLYDEPGADVVRAAESGARVSALNFAEVVSKLVDNGMLADIARQTAAELPYAIIALDKIGATEAGILRLTTRRAGLSLGDRVCIALAAELGLPILTADRQWARLDLGVDVQLIR